MSISYSKISHQFGRCVNLVTSCSISSVVITAVEQKKRNERTLRPIACYMVHRERERCLSKAYVPGRNHLLICFPYYYTTFYILLIWIYYLFIYHPFIVWLSLSQTGDPLQNPNRKWVTNTISIASNGVHIWKTHFLGVVVIPRRALAQTRGPPHAGPEGCESAQTPQPPAAILERPP